MTGTHNITHEHEHEYEGSTSTRRKWCYLSDMPIEKLVPHGDSYLVIDESDEALFVNGDNNATDAHGRMALDSSFIDTWSPIKAVGTASRRRLDEAPNRTSTDIFYGRKCTCARGGDYYCPIETNICRVWDSGVFVFSHGSPVHRCEPAVVPGIDWAVHYILPLIACINLFYMCYLGGTVKGRNAMGFARKLLCCWGEERYQQALVNEVEESARRHYFSQLAQPRSRRVFDCQPRQKVSATLKTRILDKTSMTHSECMICLADFEEGDRVGDLPCGHLFHLEPCLKQWLGRKNHCPLCCAQNLAIPTSEEQGDVSHGRVLNDAVEEANLEE